MNDITDLFYERIFKSLWMHNLNYLEFFYFLTLFKVKF
jgi:hypothetical protein